MPPNDTVRCDCRNDLLEGRAVWVLWLSNKWADHRTLLLSKVSEAVRPAEPGNHVGAGATVDEFLQAQPGVRLVVNGGFNHYRQDFYAWPHQQFQVGDPVGLVKIRQHVYDDVLEPGGYGFLVQREKQAPWQIVEWNQLDRASKYILGCTPLLLREGVPTRLPAEAMVPMPVGQVNPPSVLGHGLQRHPRTAVGTRGEELCFIVVEGGAGPATEGCTLPELQQVGVELQLEQMLNLDGGGSSQFRLRTDEGWIQNQVAPADTQRVLGNVLVLFEEVLKRPQGL